MDRLAVSSPRCLNDGYTKNTIQINLTPVVLILKNTLVLHIFRYFINLLFISFLIWSKISRTTNFIPLQICTSALSPFVLMDTQHLVRPRYLPQFLNSQSERSSTVKQDGQKSIVCSTSCDNWLRPIFRPVVVEINK